MSNSVDKKREYLKSKYGETEYKITPGKREVSEGKEITVRDEDTGGVYAGEWLRDMMKSGYKKDINRILLGYAEDKIQGAKPAYIKEDSMYQHTAIFGASGFGKTTVLKNMMVQLAYRDRGFCFIDPKGKDIEDFVRLLPESRLDDIVWVNPDDVNRDMFVGFNLFETASDPDDPFYEREIEEIISDFHLMIEEGIESGQGGAIISNTTKEVTNALIRLEENYTILDLVAILESQDEREALANCNLPDIHTSFLRQLATMENDEFGALFRYLREWVRPEATRKLIAQEETSINLSEVVEDGKILLIKGGNLSEDVQRLIFMMIIRRLWSSIKTRNEKYENPDPFYMIMDEFDIIGKTAKINIRDMLSKGRSMKLGLVLSTQQPNQLHSEIKEQVLSNSKNIFTFNPGKGNKADARKLTEILDINADEVMKLPEFKLVGLVHVGDGADESSETILINTYPPYPPRRSLKETRKILDYSVRKYGIQDEDIASKKYGVLGRQQREDTQEEKDEETLEKELLKTIMRAEIVHGGVEIEDKKGWVSKDEIIEESEHYLDVDSKLEIDRYLERLTGRQTGDQIVESRVRSDDEIYFRLTGKGEEKIWKQDTGSGGSSGKYLHRQILKKSYSLFTKLGYIVDLPEQKGQEQPDGVAEPPFNPLQEAESLKEVEEVKEKMKKDYPVVWNISEDRTLYLEAESPRREKKNAGSNPKQIIRNLAKAKNQKGRCAFITFESDPENDNPPEYNAEGIRKIIEEPPFAKETKTGNMQYYCDRGIVTGNSAIPLIKAEKSKTIWEKENGKIVLKHPDTKKAIAVFNSYQDIENANKNKFPYHTYESPSTGEQVVMKKQSGAGREEKEVARYKNLSEVKQDYNTISPPVIPENIFNDMPRDKDWIIVLLPYDKEGGITEPKVYDTKTKTLKSIYEYDEFQTTEKRQKTKQSTNEQSTNEEQKDLEFDL